MCEQDSNQGLKLDKFILSCLPTEPPPPNPPQMVQAQSIAPTATTIAWLSPSPQAHLPISQYILSLTDLQFGLPQLNATTNGSDLLHTFYGLEEYNSYQCDIASVSRYGGVSLVVTVTFRTSAAGQCIIHREPVT